MDRLTHRDENYFLTVHRVSVDVRHRPMSELPITPSLKVIKNLVAFDRIVHYNSTDPIPVSFSIAKNVFSSQPMDFSVLLRTHSVTYSRRVDSLVVGTYLFSNHQASSNKSESTREKKAVKNIHGNS